MPASVRKSEPSSNGSESAVGHARTVARTGTRRYSSRALTRPMQRRWPCSFQPAHAARRRRPVAACSSRSSTSTPGASSPTRRSPAGPSAAPLRAARPAVRRRARRRAARRARRGLPRRGLPRRRRAGPARAADAVRQRRAGGARRRAARRPAARSRAPRPASCASSSRSPSARSPPARPSCCAPSSASARSAGPIALDDVGADPTSLAFMPLLRPEVVKLDLRLVQERPGPAIAAIMNAVNAYAERTGALAARRGHRDAAAPRRWPAALGARLGQGWLFGRPASEPPARCRSRELRAAARRRRAGADALAVRLPAAPGTPLRRRAPRRC